MSDAWAAAAAALGASLLTGTFTWLLSTRERRESRAGEATRERVDAYVALLDATHEALALAMTGRTLLMHRVGLVQSASVLMRLTRSVDIDALQDLTGAIFVKVENAQARVWATGSPDGIRAANALALATTAYLDSSIAMTPRQKRLVGVSGLRPSSEQERATKAALESVHAARIGLLRVVRAEAGNEPTPLEDVA